MEKDTYTTDIVFRVDTTKEFKGEVIALFPHEVADFDGNVTAYLHIGQHTSADYNYCIKRSRIASEEESKELRAELEGRGYNINVVKRQDYRKFLKSWDKVKRVNL